MFRSVCQLMISAALFGFLSVSFAAEENVLSLKNDFRRGDIKKPQGLWPFLGVGLGVMDSNEQVRTGGVTNHVKILGSYYFDETPWIADAGIGLHTEFLTQKGGGSDTVHSLYTEFAARYQLTNKWQLGAIWNTLVDNPDRYRSNTENLASFIGLQAMKEFVWSDEYLVRAGARAMTDVGIGRETVDTVMAEIQVSFGRGKSAPVAQQAPPPQPVAPHLATRAVQTYVFEDPGPVHFETDSTKLVPASQTYFRRLARALADNRHLFDKVEVIGHADQRGPDTYNRKLSSRRAQTITNLLATAGVNVNQLRAQGRGESELLTTSMTPQALQKNRRVQLQFHGVKNHQALKNIIESIHR